MAVPTPVVIANGMVFAIADGDNPQQSGPSGGVLNTAQRVKDAGHVILYVLDAITGKVLYSSGDTIKQFSHFSAPVVAGGRVFLTTHDSTLYAFSLGSPSER
jgi:outer membrane protein assembly factor BamB